jgi:thiol-disulfide isomerase/thioredoxin
MFLTSCARGEKSSAGAAQVGQEFPLTPADEGRLRAVLQKNRGQVIVLNFWATWCEPCREEFPDLLKLHENYRLKGLNLLLLSMDDADQVQEVKKFLREKAVNFESYIRSRGDFETFVNSIDPNWIGGIPATFVFDRQGNRIASLFGAQKYGRLAGVVRPLL